MVLIGLLGTRTLLAQTILLPSGSSPFATELDLQANIALVANRNTNSVSIVDLATNTLKTDSTGKIISIAVGVAPISIAINPTTNRAVVANFGSANVSIIDLSSNTVVATVAVDLGPRAVAIDTQHNIAIVANLNANSLSLIDLNSNTSILPQAITVGQSPIAVAYNPENNTALVANYAGSTVTVVDLNLKIPTSTISSVGLKPVAIALNPTTKRAVVASQGTADIYLINLSDNTLIGGSVSVGGTPFDVDVDTKTNVAAVLLNSNQSIALVNLSGDTPTKYTTAVTGVGDNPTGISVNSTKHTAIVCNPTSDSIYVVPLGFINYLPFAFDTSIVRSNLGINNLTANEATVEIDLSDKDGKLLKTGSVTVPANGLKHIPNINQFLLGPGGSNTQGSLKLVSNQPISSFLSLIDSSSNDPSIELGRSVGYPKFVINAVTNQTPYRSQLALLNLGNTAAAVSITAYDNATGAVLITKTGISVAVGGFYYSNDILTDLGLSQKFGTLEIESPNLQPLIGVTILSNANRTNGLFEAVPIQ